MKKRTMVIIGCGVGVVVLAVLSYLSFQPIICWSPEEDGCYLLAGRKDCWGCVEEGNKGNIKEMTCYSRPPCTMVNFWEARGARRI